MLSKEGDMQHLELTDTHAKCHRGHHKHTRSYDGCLWRAKINKLVFIHIYLCTVFISDHQSIH